MVKRTRGYKRSWNVPVPVENAGEVTGRAAPTRYSRALLDETKAVWQPYYSEALTDEQAREIIDNVAGLARFLVREAKQHKADCPQRRAPDQGQEPPLPSR